MNVHAPTQHPQASEMAHYSPSTFDVVVSETASDSDITSRMKDSITIHEYSL